MSETSGAAEATAVLDASELSSYGFSTRSLMWWGTAGLMLIESTVFALGIGAYFYLRALSERWPPHTPPPALLWAR